MRFTYQSYFIWWCRPPTMCISVQPLSTASWPAGEDLLVAHHVALGVAQVGAERTERAAIDADVRRVEVRVDVVVGDVAVLPLADEVGQLADFVQRHVGLVRGTGRRRATAARRLRPCRGWGAGWVTMCEAWYDGIAGFAIEWAVNAEAVRPRPPSSHLSSITHDVPTGPELPTANRPRLITALTLKNAAFTRERSSGRTSSVRKSRARRRPRRRPSRSSRSADTRAAGRPAGRRADVAAAASAGRRRCRAATGTLCSLAWRSKSKSWQA